VGYVVAVPINKGEQITTTKFIRPEEIGLAFVIPEGMVAVSIPVNEIIGVSNLINIGDRVNIIATFFPEEEEKASTAGAVTSEEGESEFMEAITAESEGASIGVEKETTKILLWNVEVLYIGTRIISYGKTEENSEVLGAQTNTETGPKEITTVTLALTPGDSEKLVFTEETGSVWLALVPTDGIEEEKTPGRTIDNIFGE
jgi:Flp pilus assembly protein CpaB